MVQPWTEDPKARRDALAATRVARRGPALRHIAALEAMHASARAMVAAGKRLGRAGHFRFAREIAFIGENNLANLSAIRNLATMVSKKGRRFYVNAGGPERPTSSASGLEATETRAAGLERV